MKTTRPRLVMVGFAVLAAVGLVTATPASAAPPGYGVCLFTAIKDTAVYTGHPDRYGHVYHYRWLKGEQHQVYFDRYQPPTGFISDDGFFQMPTNDWVNAKNIDKSPSNCAN